MSTESPAMTRQALLEENAWLRARLAEAEETLRAIRTGEVDASHRLLEKTLASGNVAMVQTDDGEGANGLTPSQQSPPPSHMQFDTLLHTAPLGLGFFDCELRFVSINERLARMNGLAPEAHIGRYISEILPSMAEPVKEVTSRILATGKPVCDHEFSGETPAAPGVIGYWNESWYPVLDGKGKIIGFGVVVEDVTERKLAEATLRESEERLRLFIENAPAAIAQFDREMRYIAASHRWMQDYGLTGENVFGRSHYEFFPDLPEAWKEVHRRTLAGEVMRAEADRFERADGSVQWVKWETLPWRTTADEIGGILIAAEEITARRNAEREQEKLVQMIEMSEDFIGTADLDGHVTYLNAGARRMIGIGLDEDLRGLKIFDLVPEKWQAFYRDFVLPTTRTQGVWKGEMQLRNLRTDALIDVHRNAFLIRDPQTGEPWCFASVMRDITERKRAMEDLRQSRADLARAQQVGQIGSWRLDLQRNELNWSEETYRIFGISMGTTLTYEAFLAAVHPDDREYVDTRWNAALRGEPYDIEHRILVDGKVKWAREHAYLELDEAGGLLGGFGITHDITERKRFEQMLHTSLKEIGDLRTAMDEHAIVAITDAKGRITFINDKFCAISKYTREELLGRDHRIINSGHHSAEFIRDLWTTISHGRVWHGELKNRAKDGTFYWVDTTIMPFLDEEGKPRQYVAVRTDITERKQTEEALRDSEQRMRLATEATGVGIWEWHIPAGRIQWDAEMFRIYGIAPTEDGFVDYGVWRDSVLPEDLARQEAILEDTCRQLGTSSREFRIQRRDNRELRHIQAVEAVRTNADGQIEWVVGTNLDITERRLAEENIQQLNIRLEQRVRDRTSQLENANHELEAFSYSVSHDLRAPLRAVIGFVRLLQNGYADSLDAEGHRLLGVVAGEALRMGRLIDDLLAFSRMGRQQVAHNSIDMAALVCAEFENLTLASPEAAPCLILKSLPPAQGDPVMLRQVFANLISNAVKFTRRQASATIEVGGASHDGWTTYYVKDNGVGFDEKYGHKLFGVFQRLHSANDFEGNGVGLALVQRIVHRHGGQVRAEGKPGAGATFYFILPTSPLEPS